MSFFTRDGVEALGRHFLTFCAVMGVLWVGGKPALGQFVNDTVDARIGKVESSILALQNQQTTSAVAQAGIKVQLEQLLREQQASGRDTDRIIQLLQQLQFHR